ncbi:MAG: hypothetical protein C5B50_17590 [Verrucomicrobia bacterium]|nr:MAG: hypothetical protein C5B50_17590 [Verrucomicrobiota bacterium]
MPRVSSPVAGASSYIKVGVAGATGVPISAASVAGAHGYENLHPRQSHCLSEDHFPRSYTSRWVVGLLVAS